MITFLWWKCITMQTMQATEVGDRHDQPACCLSAGHGKTLCWNSLHCRGFTYVPHCPWGKGGHLDLLWFSVTQMCVSVHPSMSSCPCPSVSDFVYAIFHTVFCQWLLNYQFYFLNAILTISLHNHYLSISSKSFQFGKFHNSDHNAPPNVHTRSSECWKSSWPKYAVLATTPYN